MKNQEQIEKRIQKLENRIKDLWVRYDKIESVDKSQGVLNNITKCEEKIDLLNWVLGKEVTC